MTWIPIAPTNPADKTRVRRLSGVCYGAGLGLMVAILTQVVIPLQAPGIPLYMPPSGPLLNSVWIILAGIFTVGFACWFESSFLGVMAAAFVDALALLGLNLLTGNIPIYQQAASLVVSFFLVVPVAGLLLPALIVVRIGINHFSDHRTEPFYLPRRALILALVGLAVAGLCTLAFLSPEAKTVLTRTNAMISQGMQAETSADLLLPLQKIISGDFLQDAGGHYQLEWRDDLADQYEIPYTYVPEYMLSVCIVHFENGWNLVCLYTGPDKDPRCKGFTRLP